MVKKFKNLSDDAVMFIAQGCNNFDELCKVLGASDGTVRSLYEERSIDYHECFSFRPKQFGAFLQYCLDKSPSVSNLCKELGINRGYLYFLCANYGVKLPETNYNEGGGKGRGEVTNGEQNFPSARQAAIQLGANYHSVLKAVKENGTYLGKTWSYV